MNLNTQGMKSKHVFKSILQWLLFTLGAIVLAISSRVFIFGVFTIPTPSMEPTIMAGDRVIVNKLVPGSRVITNLFSLKKGVKPEHTRFSGYRAVERNDVLVFNFPYSDWHNLVLDMSTYYAKRCVAIPGDTFYIDNGIYKVKGVSDTLGYFENQQVLSEREVSDFDAGIYHTFPFDEHYNWDVKNFGPLYLPKENETLAIDTLNIILYRNLIKYETDKHVTVKDSHVYLGDSIIDKYTFLKNYYFTAGDLVFDSQDSRYWGLLPEDHIVGKVSFVYKSVDPHTGDTRWDRFLKSID